MTNIWRCPVENCDYSAKYGGPRVGNLHLTVSHSGREPIVEIPEEISDQAQWAARKLAEDHHPFDGTEPDWVVIARRKTEEAFMAGFRLGVKS